METKHDYRFDASWELDKLGDMIERLRETGNAEIVNVEIKEKKS
jgi:hypothetical protein